MKKILFTITALAVLSLSSNALAHFGVITPSNDIVSQRDNRTISLQAKFIHPMEGHYMEMAKPKQFGVLHKGKKTDLRGQLTEAKGKSPDQEGTFTFWKADYSIKRPGDYTFYMAPEPYWEPAEDVFIIHYTKVCVNAFGLEAGWDEPVGLETEIIPLTRPYGLWTNNLFTGQVLVNGKPVPGAAVEVEYLNASTDNPAPVHPSSDPYVTQVVKANADGVFSYAMPRAGWWGFAALNEAAWTIKHDGTDKHVEIGAVYWVHTRDMK